MLQSGVSFESRKNNTLSHSVALYLCHDYLRVSKPSTEGDFFWRGISQTPLSGWSMKLFHHGSARDPAIPMARTEIKLKYWRYCSRRAEGKLKPRSDVGSSCHPSTKLTSVVNEILLLLLCNNFKIKVRKKISEVNCQLQSSSFKYIKEKNNYAENICLRFIDVYTSICKFRTLTEYSFFNQW